VIDLIKVSLVGIGMGDSETLTSEAKKAIEKAEVIIGAKRMIEMTKNADKGKIVFVSYDSNEIVNFIETLAEDCAAAILFSGDTGFYSGAKKLLDILKELRDSKNFDIEIEILPGISSISYFCSKLKINWEDTKILSIHGKRQNLIMYIKRYKKVFSLLSGKDDIKHLHEKLLYYGLENVTLYIGQRLSYPDEKIIACKAYDLDLDNNEFDNLSVILVENPLAEDISLWSINDDMFVRGDVPMTKSEVRALTFSKMCLSPNSILYDIGGGTGSVSIEAALKIIDGEVYSIEKNEKAIHLIEKNKRKFTADNINIIKGEAPKALENLPKPTHVFIGGSSGNIEKIVECVLNKNPIVKIAATAISLTTIEELLNVIKKLSLKSEIFCLNVSKSKAVGNHNLMFAQNPIYIFIINKAEDKDK